MRSCSGIARHQLHAGRFFHKLGAVAGCIFMLPATAPDDFSTKNLLFMDGRGLQDRLPSTPRQELGAGLWHFFIGQTEKSIYLIM